VDPIEARVRRIFRNYVQGQTLGAILKKVSAGNKVQGSPARPRQSAAARRAFGQRYGPSKALSTRQPVKDFMILAGFSRCVRAAVGRVSGLPNRPVLRTLRFASSRSESRLG